MSEHWSFPWEWDAMQGNPMPEGLDLVNQLAYVAMRHIYRSYYAKFITREQGTREKKMIQKTYSDAVKDMDFADRVNQKHIQVLKGTELAASACRKEPTPENALRLCDVLVGLKVMEGLG